MAGSPVPCAATASAGLSTFAGEAVVGEACAVLAGLAVAAACGSSEGTADAVARVGELRATCAEGLADGESCGVCTRVAPGVAVDWRATWEADDEACTSAAARGATFVATADASVTTFGVEFGDCRPVGDGLAELLAVGEGVSDDALAREALATVAGEGDVAPLAVVGSPAARAT